ncbi:MAG: UPF0175 family protein [Desulfobacterales bacterium]|nr:UPF0175 family protein [Desulfobacterales bacterium]
MEILVEVQQKYLIKCGFYADEGQLRRDAFRSLLLLRPECRLEIAIQAYKEGEISLAKAAEMAGLCFEDMCELLSSRGIQAEIGYDSVEDLQRDYKALKGALRD